MSKNLDTRNLALEAEALHHGTDVRARRRNTQGDRIPWSIAYHTPTSDGPLVEESYLEPALAEIEAKDPIEAHRLRELLHRVRVAHTRLTELRREAQGELVGRNTQVELLDVELEGVMNLTDKSLSL